MKIKKPLFLLFASVPFVFCLAAGLYAADANPEGFQTLDIGDQAPDFTLPGIDGRDYSLADFKDSEILMVFFTSNHCPTSHAAEGRLQKMLSDIKAQKRSFGFVAINPNNPEGMTPAELGFGRYTDSFEDMVSYARENGWTFPYLYDGDKQIVARAYGCLATPHVFIFDKERTLKYKGRFDDSRFPDPATVKSHDAINALDALFAGRSVPVEVTKPHGCSTKWREKKANVAIAQAKWESLPVEVDTIDAAGVASLRANGTNKYRLIYLWATWCSPCVAEYPDLVYLQRVLGMRPFELITISLDDPKDPNRVQAFLEKNHAATPPKLKEIAKTEGRKGNHYIFTGTAQDELSAALDPDWPGPLPHTIIVDPNGEIIYRHNGKIDPTEVRSVLIDAMTPYWSVPGASSNAVARTHTYEIVEESFTAEKSYDNPYMDVELWVDLSGPDGQQIKIPAFWDGGQIFRVRMMATAPGTWKWSTGNWTGDSGLDGKHGSFSVTAWTDQEKVENPNRRGIIRVAGNGHTLEYPDGTPFFLTGDTCYSALTKIYSWSSSAGKAGLSFQDYIAQRKAQGFNSIAIISCFPSDTKVKLWQAALHGEKIGEDGSTPFEMHSDMINPANFLRINPTYFQLADRKMEHLWDNGFVPLLETVRRHEKWYEEDADEKAAFTNFVRYLWARWGCYNMIFDWLHWDNDPSVYASWLPMVKAAHETLGSMPYGTPKTAMSYITCLTSWYKDVPQALEINNISNWPRTVEQFDHQVDLYNVTPPVPTLNIEPFYPGWNHPPSGGLTHTEFAMLIAYGSVLNGGLAGHIWGDIYWGGVATRTYSDGDVRITAAEPHAIGMNKFKAASMGRLKAFVLDAGHDYSQLKPATFTHLKDHQGKTIALAINDAVSEVLGFVAARRPESVGLKNFPANKNYTLQWWDIDKGQWQGKTILTTTAAGTMELPETPDKNRSWAFRLLQDANGSTVTIAINSSSPSELFGAGKVEEALRRMNVKPVVVDKGSAVGTATVRVDMVQSGVDPQIKEEGFCLENSSGSIVVRAIDSTGAMYGLLELAEQIDLHKGLSKVEADLQNPRFPFRAIKFNLPWSSYRRFSALQVNEPLCKDLKMWEAFLDMMAEDRLNVLTLWNMHPFPYLIRAKNFPKATPFSDQELAEWKTFWTTLFKMANDRGIETYLVNWNVFVSEEFKEHYDKAGVSDMEKFLGDIEDTQTIRRYTRESITQVINEYPGLTGLGVTLGERMENLNSEQQTDWVEDVFFRGIKEADRPIKFIYRAALKGDHAVHRAAIDGSGLPEPIWVELKFNWSHGHSTPTLVKAHGGGTGKEYWTNPAPSHHKMCWMIRNEDFFRLRCGEPDFIRAHIEQNGQDYVGGYFVGSETMIPAQDIFHKPDHDHVNWKYAFERQWLFYKEWGRLLYNPETPDAAFANAFDVRYEGGHGEDMVEAFKLSTRTNQRILSFFKVAQDATNYAEGFLGLRKFLTVRDVIESTPTDPNYVSVEEFGNGSSDFGVRLTPIELATALEGDSGKALALVKGISTADHTLKCEIEDVKAWSYLGLYFADKLRAAVAINQKDQVEAVKYITQAQQHWADLVIVTEAHIIPGYVYGAGATWHWSAYQDEVAADVDWVKNQGSK